jgi:iron complex outermembrane receptor protein
MGGSFASEKLDDRSSFIDSGVLQSTSSVELERKIASAYAELFMPIVGGNGHGQRLELSLAGRYDDYDDFGSSANPKAGVLWSPVAGLNLRATWGKSFRPPLLPDLIDRPLYFVFDLPDPNAMDGVTPTLANISIGSPSLNPERSESFTAGIDWRPAAIPELAIGLTYFDVDFSDRVARPPIVGSIFDIHGQRDTLAPFFDLSPDLQEVADLFARGLVVDTTGLGPAGVEVSFDNRPANIAAMQQAGIDLHAAYERSTDVGEFSISLGASHLLKNEYAALEGGSTESLLDLIGQPVDTRLNASIAWSRSSLQAVLSLSHWTAYRDTLAIPPGKVDSWTTADILLTYNTGQSRFAHFVSGFNFALALRNATDEPPPSAATNVGYDAANASPLGRFLSLSVTKDW